jgi:hypothetical protein
MDVVTAGLASFLGFAFLLGAAHRLENDRGIGDYFALIFAPGVVVATLGLFALLIFLSFILRPPVYNLNLNVQSAEFSAGSAHVRTPDTVVDVDIRGKQVTGVTGTIAPAPQPSPPLSSFEVRPQDLAVLSFVALIPIAYTAGYYLTDVLMGGRALLSALRRPSARAPAKPAPPPARRPGGHVAATRSAGGYRLEITPDMRLRLVRDL